jgi:hypothetical protein
MAISRVTFGDPDFVDSVGQTASGAQVQNKLNALRDAWNGLVASGLAADDLSASAAELIGVSAGGVVRRGRSVQATAGSRASVSYGALDNGPDEVARLVLPTDGLLCVSYRALVKESVWGAARVAVFVNGVQLLLSAANNSVPASAQECSVGALGGTTGPNVTGVYRRVVAGDAGLAIAGDGYAGDATFGSSASPLLTNHLECEMAAGTYTVGVQYKASSGTVTAQDRKLRVWALAFG